MTLMEGTGAFPDTYLPAIQRAPPAIGVFRGFARIASITVRGERVHEPDLHCRDPVDGAWRNEAVGERGGGFCRPDRMRRRRTDADLEQFENADHRLTSGGRRLPGRPLKDTNSI
jgi:hypothetical protein